MPTEKTHHILCFPGAYCIIDTLNIESELIVTLEENDGMRRDSRSITKEGSFFATHFFDAVEDFRSMPARACGNRMTASFCVCFLNIFPFFLLSGSSADSSSGERKGTERKENHEQKLCPESNHRRAALGDARSFFLRSCLRGFI